MNIIMLAMACLGQAYCPPICIDYIYGDMPVQSRFMTQVKYDDGRYWNVYVVNGYLPTVTFSTTAGVTSYVYDYRGRIAYKPEPKKQFVIKKPLEAKPSKPMDIKPLPLVPTPDPIFTQEKKVSNKTPDMTIPSTITEPERVIRPSYGRQN